MPITITPDMTDFHDYLDRIRYSVAYNGQECKFRSRRDIEHWLKKNGGGDLGHI